MKRALMLLGLAGCASAPPYGQASSLGNEPGWRFAVEMNFELEAPPTATIRGPASVEIDDLRFDVGPTAASVAVHITNLLDESARVPWDQAAFIATDGASSRVVTGDTRMIDIQRSQPAGVIAAGSRLEATVFPTRYVTRDGAQRFLPRHFRVTYGAVAPTAADVAPELFDIANDLTGQRFGLVIPIEKRGEVTEYTFWFIVAARVTGPFRIGGTGNEW